MLIQPFICTFYSWVVSVCLTLLGLEDLSFPQGTISLNTASLPPVAGWMSVVPKLFCNKGVTVPVLSCVNSVQVWVGGRVMVLVFCFSTPTPPCTLF